MQIFFENKPAIMSVLKMKSLIGGNLLSNTPKALITRRPYSSSNGMESKVRPFDLAALQK